MTELAQRWESYLIVMALLMGRMLVAFYMIPLFAGTSVPTLVRTGVAAGLALALMPMALADANLTAISIPDLFLYLAKEAVIGLVLGLIAGTGFWALYIAGTIIENQVGMAMNGGVDPFTGTEDSIVGGLLVRLFSALFLLAGGLLALIGMLFESYQLWPLSSMTPVVGNHKLVDVALQVLGDMMLLAFKVAAPFLILMLLIELALGLLSRFAPALNVFFVSLPMKALVLVVLLLLYCLMLAGGVGVLPIVDFSHSFDFLQGALHE